jgi:type III secretion protein J
MRHNAPLRALLVATFLLAGCSVELQHSLGEEDANKIFVLLSENGIAAKKVAEEGGNEPTYLITVPKQDAAQALKLLTEHSLPRPRPSSLGDFKKISSMVPTATQERAMFLDALGGEVTSALNRVDGVLEARAIVMIPEVSDLTQEDKKPLPTASVLVKYRPNRDGRPPLDEERVRSFVAGVVPELRKEAVTVLLSEAQPLAVEIPVEQRLMDVGGLRMTVESASRFKMMMALTGVVVLGLAGFTAYTILRGFGVAGLGRSRRGDDED